MTTMRYVRALDSSAAPESPFQRCRTQVLSHLESALMVATFLEPGGRGPSLHYHRRDKVYYVLEGTLHVLLGEEMHTAAAGTLVFVPAGLAHRAWNDGPAPVRLWEMVVPSPSPLAEVDLLVDSTADVPAEYVPDRQAYVRTVAPQSLTEALPGMWVQTLADAEAGSEHTTIFYVEVGPGDAGPDLHIHEFDQYYLVIEGQLTVEVALQQHVVDAPALVLLPAGVPHRQYNDGAVTEKHLAVVSPNPEPGRPVDQKVLFCARETVTAAAGG